LKATTLKICYFGEVNGMSKVDYSAEAELFPARRRSPKVGYKRFSSAALAIQYAIEHLPNELLGGSFLEFGDARFGAEGIRKLYESDNYPLSRTEKEESMNMIGPKSSAWIRADAQLDLSKRREPDLKRDQRQVYEATALKTQRLRDLRLAKEAAEKEAVSPAQLPTGPTIRRSRQT
jgi:hypothetical protein